MSLPLLVYALVAHVDFNEAFKAVLVPGGLVIVLLSVYSAWVGTKEKVEPRAAASCRRMAQGGVGRSSGSCSSRCCSAWAWARG